MESAVAELEGAEAALRLAVDLRRSWFAFGQLRYATDTLRRLIEPLANADGSPVVGRAAIVAGTLSLWLTEFESARALFETGLRHFERTGDVVHQVEALGLLSEANISLLDLMAAKDSLATAERLASTLADEGALLTVQRSLALLAYRLGDCEGASRHWAARLHAALQDSAHSSEGRAARFQLARIGLDVADYAAAVRQIDVGASSAAHVGDGADLARWHHLHGIVLTELGEFDEALTTLRQAIDHYRAEGTPRSTPWVEDCLAQLAL